MFSRRSPCNFSALSLSLSPEAYRTPSGGRGAPSRPCNSQPVSLALLRPARNRRFRLAGAIKRGIINASSRGETLSERIVIPRNMITSRRASCAHSASDTAFGPIHELPGREFAVEILPAARGSRSFRCTREQLHFLPLCSAVFSLFPSLSQLGS